MGYKDIKLSGKKIGEHRHIVETMLGRKLSRSEVVHHINEDKIDNRIENLLVMSLSDHTKLHMNGENAPSNKLRKEDVINIRKLLASTSLTYRDIAKIYGVNENTISDIKSCRTWRHILELTSSYNEANKVKRLPNKVRNAKGDRFAKRLP